jgi:hypothetical protein
MSIPFNQAAAGDELSTTDEQAQDSATSAAETKIGIESARAGSQAHEHVEKHKFVGRSREREDILKTMAPRLHSEPPGEVLRWSEVLGLDASALTAEDIHRAWRKAISSPEVHPDLGGAVETAILLNTAKDSLTKWLDTFTPKLGKQFLHK